MLFDTRGFSGYTNTNIYGVKYYHVESILVVRHAGIRAVYS